MNTRTLALVTLSLAACAYDDLALEEDQEAIEDGTPANSFQVARAVDFVGMNCTGTRIGPRHVLTALHCNPRKGIKARFYTSASASNPTPEIEVVDVFIPDGTALSGSAPDTTDNLGRQADIAVLELESTVTIGAAAVMAWSYPGQSYYVAKVGGGNHEGVPNEDGELQQRWDYTHSGDDDDGRFLTNQYGMNLQDSGGPVYYNGRVLGVHKGGVWDVVARGNHTSVPAHLPFILEAMNFRWTHRPDTDTYRSGSTLAVHLGRDLRECEYICINTGACNAFNHFASSNYCQLLSSASGATTAIAGVTSAEK